MQEVWAAGVTYLRSKDARMEESDFSATAYDRVYDARARRFSSSHSQKRLSPAASRSVSVPMPSGMYRNRNWC